MHWRTGEEKTHHPCYGTKNGVRPPMFNYSKFCYEGGWNRFLPFTFSLVRWLSLWLSRLSYWRHFQEQNGSSAIVIHHLLPFKRNTFNDSWQSHRIEIGTNRTIKSFEGMKNHCLALNKTARNEAKCMRTKLFPCN